MELTVDDLKEIMKVVTELDSVQAEVEKVWVGKHGVRLRRDTGIYIITGIWTRSEAEGGPAGGSINGAVVVNGRRDYSSPNART